MTRAALFAVARNAEGRRFSVRFPALVLVLCLAASGGAAVPLPAPEGLSASAASAAPRAVSPAASAPAAYAGDGPVLAAICYHRFGVETLKDPYRISLKRLSSQMSWLRARGWKSVSLTQVAAALEGDTRSLPPKGVLLSVDDGYKAGALSARVFRRYGFHAVYFVVPSVLGDGAFLSYKDLRVLEAQGDEIGCHTLTHPDLAKVPRGMDPAGYVHWVDHELQESKRELEAGLGHPVTALAWPYGAYNPAVAAAALRAGYRQLWSVSGGLNLGVGLDRARLRRILLMGHPPLETFRRRMLDLPLRVPIAGISEGALVYRSQLPLRLGVPRGVRAALGGQPLVLDAQGGATLRRLRNGFHYLNFAEESGSRRETSFLFQVAPDAWRPYFEALAAGPDAPAAAAKPVPAPGAREAPSPTPPLR